MNIVVIGSGYVGLVSGACLAEFGHKVTCVDKDAAKIERLNSGEIPIYEPGLDALVANNVSYDRLCFLSDGKEAIQTAEVIFIAVGTPTNPVNGHADLKYVYAAAKEIAPLVQGFKVVVNKSTVPIGTGDEVEAIFNQINPQSDVEVVSNPEFLREGSAITDFMQPDRVVIGSNNERAREVMSVVYERLFATEATIQFTQRRAAEVIKYAANAFLATKITFINEVADLCEKVSVDVLDVSKGIGLDTRIGSRFLNPGPGYGGSCFPKDTLALYNTSLDAGAPLKIVKTVMEVNVARKKAMAAKIISAMDGKIAGKTIAILGLAFKANTDDMRDAPSIDIVPILLKAGATLRVYDPEATEEARPLLGDKINYCQNAFEALADADALVILTDWDEFRKIQPSKIKSMMRKPQVIDLRNIYSPVAMQRSGIDYEGLGRVDLNAEI